ncbi:hypothetical protein B0H13DRAFT_2315652 [Mycena leptocephala]|nr:hypothetical protein B0H13DRAFT_2315652 [Mycena leptocephala]
MPVTRSSARPAAAAPAANTRSAGHTNATRPETRLGPRANTSRKKKTKKKIAEPPNPPEVAPDEALAVVPSDDEPEDNEKIINAALEKELKAIPDDDEPEDDTETIASGAGAGDESPSDDEPEDNGKIINAAPGKELKAVPDDDRPEDDTETIASGTGAGDESRPRSPAAESLLPPSSPPLASSSPPALPANSPLSPLASQHAAPTFSLKPTRPLPRRRSPRSKTVPRPATGNVNDDLFSLAHRRRVPRRLSVSSDHLWESVGSEPQLNSDNLDDFSISTQGLQGHLDADERADVEDAHMGDNGDEKDAYKFTDLTTVGYHDPDDMEEPLADYDSPPPRRTRPSLSPRPSRSLSPASPPKPLRCGNSRSITIGPVSPRTISRGRSRTPSRPNTNKPSSSRAASRGRSRARRTSNALTPQPPTQAGDAPAAPHAQGVHNLPIPPARGPPPPIPPAHTRPPVSRLAIAPAPVSPRRSPTSTRIGGRNACPRPERLPSPSRDLSSDDSTDEYGRTQEAKRRLEAARVARGYSPAAASDADDDDDMRDYLAEVATNGFCEDDARGKSSRRKAKAKAATATSEKGKRRAPTMVSAPGPESTDLNPEEIVEEDVMECGYTPGPVPRQILEQLYALEEDMTLKSRL